MQQDMKKSIKAPLSRAVKNTRLNAALGVSALAAVILFQATSRYAASMVVATAAWALQGVSLLAIDISKKGGEL